VAHCSQAMQKATATFLTRVTPTVASRFRTCCFASRLERERTDFSLWRDRHVFSVNRVQKHPFTSRCWPAKPEHHISTVYRLGKKSKQLVAAGIETIQDIPDYYPLKGIPARQVRSVRVTTQGFQSSRRLWSSANRTLSNATTSRGYSSNPQRRSSSRRRRACSRQREASEPGSMGKVLKLQRTDRSDSCCCRSVGVTGLHTATHLQGARPA